MIKDFLIINCTGKKDLIGLKLNDNFFIQVFQTNIKNNDEKSYLNNSFLIGLITNIFNVKAFLFFVSLFSILIDSLYGFYFYLFPVYFAVTSAMWFIFVSYILTISVDKRFNIYSNNYISLII